jgi:hypothetical protein
MIATATTQHIATAEHNRDVPTRTYVRPLTIPKSE